MQVIHKLTLEKGFFRKKKHQQFVPKKGVLSSFVSSAQVKEVKNAMGGYKGSEVLLGDLWRWGEVPGWLISGFWDGYTYTLEE